MAGYRQFHTKFWKDEWLIDLEPLERYLFSYLFTNELSSISGIYQIAKKVIANETGLDMAFINASLEKFEAAQKCLYRDGVMWVVNMAKYHDNASPLTQKKVQADIDRIPDGIVKRAYLYYQKTGEYSIDTVSILNSLKEREREKESVIGSDGAALPPLAEGYIPQSEEERIYCKVTGHATMPSGEIDPICNAIAKIKKGSDYTEDQTITYLTPYWQAMGRLYPNSLKSFWVTDWAVMGRIPQPKADKPNGRKVPAGF